jgi:conjugative transfer signal peptidase TraF
MTTAASPLLTAGLALGLLAAAQIDSAPSLIWNASESVPVGLYVLRPSGTPSPGDLVAIRLPVTDAGWAVARGYVGTDTLLLKRVAAVSGMSVCRDALLVSIDGTTLAQAALADRHGRPLPVWIGCHTLGAEEIFLLNACVEDSLDGRYFGPMNSSQIVGRAVPLWTRGG